MGKISEFVDHRIFDPLTVFMQTRDAKESEHLGDIMARDNNPRKACDFYLVALFNYAALGKELAAQRVNAKIGENYGPTYMPTTRGNGGNMKKRINHLANTNLDHDPKNVFDTYLSTSMPGVNLEGLL